MIEIISLHIAKSGGKSFYKILQDQYGERLDPRNRRRDFMDIPKEKSLNPENIPPHINVIHGHLWYLHIQHLHQMYQPKIITWLREPVERVISNYYFLMSRIRKDANHRQKHKYNYSLLEYAHDSIQNKMTKYLEGISLEDIYFIGLTECYNKGIHLLSSQLEWKQPIVHYHINQRKEHTVFNDIKTRPSDINQRMRDEIAYLNTEDVLLYQKAKELFNYRYSNFINNEKS